MTSRQRMTQWETLNKRIENEASMGHKVALTSEELQLMTWVGQRAEGYVQIKALFYDNDLNSREFEGHVDDIFEEIEGKKEGAIHHKDRWIYNG